MATVTPSKTWTQSELEDLVIALVAAEEGTAAAAFRAGLEAKGDAMPIESLKLFNILVEFFKRTGLKIPKKVPPGTMRSVKRFAKFAAEKAETS
jgi:hypothetical protein